MFLGSTFHASVFAESFRHAGELLWQCFNPMMRKGALKEYELRVCV